MTMPAIDVLKAFACVAIVLHHLAFYGPMSDAARPLMPGLVQWFDVYGRMAVQIFLVVSGFLFAAKFAPAGRVLPIRPLPILIQRYARLVTPYSAALLLAVACSAVAGAWMDHPSVSPAPDLGQFLAHVLLLHDLLDQDALSAGVWYVAIDFQLFALAVLLLWLPSRFAGRHSALAGLLPPMLVVLMTLASLFGFNRDAWWDETALYFFGAFGLGILAWWASGQFRAGRWLALLTALAVSALVVDFRARIAVATAVMLFLGLARHFGMLHTLPVPAAVVRLSRISYSVFLVHFPLCLLVNMVVTLAFPDNPVINAMGMVLAVTLSVAGGHLFHERIERHPFPFHVPLRLRFPARVAAGGWLAALAAVIVAG